MAVTGGPLNKDGLLSRVTPFAIAALAAIALVPLETSDLATISLVAALALTLVVIASVLWLPWQLMPIEFQVAAPLVYFVVVALVRDMTNAHSDYGALVLLPVLWIALYGLRYEIYIAVAATALVFLVPGLLVGSPAYPLDDALQSALLWTIVTLLVGITVQNLTASIQRRAAETAEQARQVAEINAQFDQAFDGAPIGMALVDLDGLLTRVNDFMCKLVGLDPELAIGRPFVALAREEDREPIREAIRSLGAGASSNFQTEQRLVDDEGNELYGLLSLTLVRGPEGNPLMLYVQMQDVTERLLLERERAASERRMKDLLESAPDAMVIVDSSGEIVFVNSAATQLFGFTAEDMLGQGVELLIPSRYQKPHVDQRRRYNFHPVASEMGTERQVRGKRKDGTEFPADVRLNPIKTETGMLIASSIRDMTERLRVESDLRRLAVIVEASEEAILSCEVDGAISAWNRGAERMFGYTAAEMIDQPFALLVPPERLGEEVRVLQRVLGGESVSNYETQALHKDGHLVDVMLTVSPIMGAKRRVESLSIVTSDVTDKNRARAEADRLKDEFFSLVSHEFRTPLTSIIGYLELLQAGEQLEIDDQKREEILAVIKRNSERLARLVNDLLLVSKIQGGGFALEKSLVDLRALTEHSVQSALVAAKDGGIEIKLAASLVPPVEADGDRIAQLIDNLISNAVKYTPSGGDIDVRLEDSEAGVSLAVTNSGAYIEPDELKRLFEPFFRAANATRQEIPGVGLGLLITKSIVEAHNGEIEVESDRDKGTTFRVLLPHTQTNGNGGVPQPHKEKART